MLALWFALLPIFARGDGVEAVPIAVCAPRGVSALAHELGHYLLQSKAHTSRGLMRRVWSSDDSFAVSRSGFELTAEQRVAIFGYLAWNERQPATHGRNHSNVSGLDD